MEKTHTEEVTYSGCNSLQVQAVPGLFTVQFCIHKYNIQQWLRTKQLHIMIYANFLLPEPTCHITLAHPLSGMHRWGFGGHYNFNIMETDGCYFISDKKPRIDKLRWEGHTEKNGRKITVTCLALAPTWKKQETILCGKLILSLIWKTGNSRTYYCGECRW